MKFSNTMTIEQYIKVNKLSIIGSHIGTSIFYTYFLLCALYFIPIYQSYFAILLLIILLFIAAFSYFSAIPKAAKLIYFASKRYQNPWEHEIDEEGIRMSYEENRDVYGWDEVVSWSKEKDFFLLKYSDAKFTTISFKSIQNSDELIKLEAILTNHAKMIDSGAELRKTIKQVLFNIAIMSASAAIGIYFFRMWDPFDLR